jgi:hypothetical protein
MTVLPISSETVLLIFKLLVAGIVRDAAKPVILLNVLKVAIVLGWILDFRPNELPW